jgi:hypothetical protein
MYRLSLFGVMVRAWECPRWPPPLVVHGFPAELTGFVGREEQARAFAGSWGGIGW